MQVTLEIPDDMAQRLMSREQDPARAALEAVAIEGYRSGALSALQMRRLLGFKLATNWTAFSSSAMFRSLPIVWKTCNRTARRCKGLKQKAFLF